MKIVVEQILRDPKWEPIYGMVDGQKRATNMDLYYTKANVEAEIVSIHLKKRTMRIVFEWMGKKESRDISMPENMNVNISFA